jgi:hypothetical protein
MLSLRPSTLRLTGWAAVLLSASFLPSAVPAQSQSDNTSVAEAARRAREQKKNQTKPTRTLTNDDLPSAPATSAQPVAAAAVADQANAPAKDQAKPAGEAAPSEGARAEADAAGQKRAQTEAALKRAKAELAQAQSELDVLQRKAALDSDAYYSTADYARDTEGKAKLDANAQQVNDKKSQVEELKTRVAALQAELGETPEPEKPARQG